MLGYATVKEKAAEWNVSGRIVQLWCKMDMIDGAIRFAGAWAIPADAKKPTRTVNQKPGRKPKTSEGEIKETD
jgi:hypothetical protein